MIINLRKSFKTKTFKVFLWVIIIAASGALSLVWNWIDRFALGNKGSSWVLEINKDIISISEFRRAVADQEERIRIMRAQYGQYADLYFQMMGMKMNSQEMAVNTLITKALLNQAANQLPLYVSPALAQSQLNNPMFISQEISDLVPFFTWDQSLGGVNPLALQAYLQHIGVSESEFNTHLAQAVKRSDVRKLVEHASYIPEFALKEKFAQNFLGHKFSVMTISHADILAQVKKEPVSDEALKAYYDLANSKERRYYVPEKRSAKVITFDPLEYGIDISQEEIEKYYNNNKAHYVEQPAQVQVKRILFKIDDQSKAQDIKNQAQNLHQELVSNPGLFTQKAKDLSQDEKTASQGGLLPFFSKGQHDKTFEKTAFLLKEDNDISQVIQTNEGFEILQRVGKKIQTFKPLSKVGKDIKDLLTKKKFSGQFNNQLRPLLHAPDYQSTLQKLIKEKHGKETTVTDSAADASVLSKTIFKLKKNETSYYQEGDKGVVVTLTEIKESQLPSLDQVKEKVKEDYYKDHAAKKIKELLERVKNDPTLFDKPLPGMKVEKTGWIRQSQEYKEDQKEKEALTKKGINLGKMFQIENKGGVATLDHGATGIAIRLDDLASFDSELFAQKRATLLEQEQQQNRSLVMAGFVASLYRNAKIKKNESQIRIES